MTTSTTLEVVQCSLRSGNARTSALVYNDPRLKPGRRVTLKGETWTVESMGMVQMKAGLKRSNVFGSISEA